MSTYLNLPFGRTMVAFLISSDEKKPFRFESSSRVTLPDFKSASSLSLAACFSAALAFGSNVPTDIGFLVEDFFWFTGMIL